MKKALVCGAGGFIGSHLVKRLKSEGFKVRGADLKLPEYTNEHDSEILLGDLRDPAFVDSLFDTAYDEVYQLAADMGGAGYIFTGDNDANVMHNSALINLNMLSAIQKTNNARRIFYSSSACMYPAYNQLDPENPKCSEDSAYPAAPDSEYGWEKLFSERVYAAFSRNYGIEARVARYHNIFGPEGSWNNGKEKAPAAICRKIAMAGDGSSIEVWGDGQQTRSFLYIDECITGTLRLMRSDCKIPVNIGSEEMISINALAILVADIAGKNVSIKNIDGPVGVRGRNSDNRLIKEAIGWEPSQPLRNGLVKTYKWIAEQVQKQHQSAAA